MLLSVARHRRFYENICIFFRWIIWFTHFYMCSCISFFFLFLIQLQTWERRSWTNAQWPSPKKLQRTSSFHKARSVRGRTAESPPPSSVPTGGIRGTMGIAMQTGDSLKKKKKQFSMTDAIVEVGKSPFQLFCVCSVILSVDSAFQRSVLGMSMRKNDHQL